VWCDIVSYDGPVCVCVREREQEKECVCARVCVCERESVYECDLSVVRYILTSWA